MILRLFLAEIALFVNGVEKVFFVRKYSIYV